MNTSVMQWCVIGVLSLYVPVTAADKVHVYNGASMPIAVSSVLYTDNGHMALHARERTAIENGVSTIVVAVIAPGTFATFKRPSRVFGADRDSWFSYGLNNLAIALKSGTIAPGSHVEWVNYGSSTNDVFIGEKSSGKLYAFPSKEAFEREVGKKWQEIIKANLGSSGRSQTFSYATLRSLAGGNAATAKKSATTS